MTGQHLTDEQFTELLSGDCPFQAIQHLKTCAQCHCEFEQVQASIDDFAPNLHPVGMGSRMARAKHANCGGGAVSGYPVRSVSAEENAGSGSGPTSRHHVGPFRIPSRG